MNTRQDTVKGVLQGNLKNINEMYVPYLANNELSKGRKCISHYIKLIYN